MFEYLDELSEIIYISDPETYELLYLNESGKKIFDVENVDGQLCYQTLQGRDAPCTFCTNDRLSTEEIYTWEYVNPVSGHRYILKDRFIMRDDRPVRLEIAFDMTESDNRKAGLRNALDAEGMVLQCAHELYREESVGCAANNMLKKLGEYLEAERVYLFESAGDCAVPAYEWHAAGLSSEEEIRAVDLESEICWSEAFSRGDSIVIESVESLSETYPEQYRYLVSRGVQSLAVVPLERDGGIVGFIEIDNAPAEKTCNIGMLLKMLSYFYMATQHRIRNEEKLTALSFHDEMTGLYNRNRYIADVEDLEHRPGSLGIVFVDVNDLKEINDLFGHIRGDEILCSCAAKLVQVMGDARLYRIGGDEFVCLLSGVSEADFDKRVAALEQTFAVEQKEGGGLVAIGSEWSRTSENVSSLLLAADADMYEKKRRFHWGKAFSGRMFGQLGLRPEADAEKAAEAAVYGEQSTLLREYNMLMSAMHVSVSKHLLTEKFEVVWANDFYYEMTGYTREEYETIFNNNCQDYFANDKEEYARLSEVVTNALEAGDPTYDLLMQMPIKGGDHLWIRVVAAFTDETVDGVPVIYTTFTNVDDVVRMRHEQSITYENLPGFIAKFRLAEDGPKLLFGNERFRSFFGEPDDPKTERLFKRNIEMNSESLACHYEDMRNGKPFSFAIKAQDCAGKYATFTLVGDCVGSEGGDPVYLVLYLDTTELIEQRRLAEETSEKLRTLAFVDPITGGRNATSFDIDASEVVAAAPANSYALVSLDIQKFKVINDQYGIEAGNKALRSLYESFEACLSENEFVARISADQFSLLLRADTHDRLVERIEHLIDRAGESLEFSGERAYVLTMVAGVYLVDDPDLPMMHIQDRANVARKKTDNARLGRTCTCRFYSNEDRVQLAIEKEIENRMRAALEHGEFEVYLQPKIDLNLEKAVGAEALVRWNDPLKGLVPPNDFIPLFERNGFIVELDRYVFEQVCRLLQAWQAAGLEPVPISVNMSRVQLADLRFLEHYEQIRARYGVPSSLIEIELTETLAFENPEILAELIDAIHEAGYGCSMDGFGSGYSSLNVLKNLAVDTLKLDRVFFDEADIASSRGADVVETVIDLARKLHMNTVAEGVETEDQARFLKRAGCDMVQGFLFSAPVPIAQFEKLVYGKARGEAVE